MTMTITSPWFISPHALARMAEMNLTRQQVTAVLDDPAVTWPSWGRRVAGRGDLAVVYVPEQRVIVTVLYWTTERYERAA